MENLPPVSLVDVIAFAAVALGAVRGYFRGLSGELARVISLVAALVLGLRFYRPLAEWVMAYTRIAEENAPIAAFIITVLTAVVCLFFLRYLLKRIIKVAIEEGADKIGGVIAGLIRSVVMVLIVFLALNLWPDERLNRAFGEESLIGRLVLKAAPRARAYVEDRVQDEADAGAQ
jgi:membrane protein required for colicin V production